MGELAVHASAAGTELANLDLALVQVQLTWAEAPHPTKKVGRKHTLHSNNQDKHIFALGCIALLAKLVLSLAQLSPSLTFIY